MFKKKFSRVASALLALSLVTAGASYQDIFLNNNAIVAEAAERACRDYDYVADTSNMKKSINGNYIYAYNSDVAFLERYDSTDSSIRIPVKASGKIFKGVSKDLVINGNVTNAIVDTTKLDSIDYCNTVKGVFQKLPNLNSINGVKIFNGSGSSRTFNPSFKNNDNLMRILASLNAEDCAVVTEYMAQYLKQIVQSEFTKKNCSNDYDKIKALHDYVCAKVSYAPNNFKDKNSHCDGNSYFVRTKSDWSLFLSPDKYVICDGYSRAYALLLQAAGIESYYVGLGSHASNLVKLNGSYYHVDTTFDDGYSGWDYSHFLIEDARWNNNEYKGGQADEKAVYNGNSLLFVIRRPSTFYSSYLYQNSKWNNWNTYSKQLRCNTVFGDTNGDGKVNNTDINTLNYCEWGISSYQKYKSACDLDGNGVVNRNDYIILLNRISKQG